MRGNKLFLLAISVISITVVLSFLFIMVQKSLRTSVGPNNTQTVTPSPSTAIKFALMSDVHSDTANLKKALDKAKSDGSQFVIITGDLTMEGTEDELTAIKAILDRQSLPYYVIPGNHDTWESHRKNTAYFRQVFGDEFYSFPKGNFEFIFLSNADYQKGYTKVENRTLSNQKTWLLNKLPDCLKITCLVFLHMPLNHPRSDHIMGENDLVMAEEREELKALLIKNKATELFAGHLHYPHDYTLDGLHTTIIGALTGSSPSQPDFLEIEVTDRIISQKVPVL